MTPPTPIDLDLVELRCKLRGWECERIDDLIEVVCKYGGSLVFQSGKRIRREYPWSDTPAHKRIEAILTAPRWTLERLLSEPPEGWIVRDDLTALGRLVWGDLVQGRQHEIEARVWSWQGRLGLGVECYGDAGPDELARYAQRLKAAAELALILAEVEP